MTQTTEEKAIEIIEDALWSSNVAFEGSLGCNGVVRQIIADLTAAGLYIATDLKAMVEREGLASATIQSVHYDHRAEAGRSASVQWLGEGGYREIATADDANSFERALAVAMAERATKLEDVAVSKVERIAKLQAELAKLEGEA